jgi:predicted dehydrogenase
MPGRLLSAAIIGAGAIAREHLTYLAQVPNVSVVALADRSLALGRAMADRYSVSNVFSNHQDLLSTMRPDVVHITTPPASHVAIAMDGLDAGAHVFVEKPVSVTREDWLQLRDKVQAAGRVLVEDQNYLFDPAVRHLQNLVRQGDFGEVRHVDARFVQEISSPDHAFGDRNVVHPANALPGGAVFDFLPHLCGFATTFCGRHDRVTTNWRSSNDGPVPYDEFVALVEAREATATLSFSASARPEGFWVTVSGTRMAARLNLYDGSLLLDRDRPQLGPLAPVVAGLETGARSGSTAIGAFVRKVAGHPGSYMGLKKLIELFYQALDSGSPAPVSLEHIDSVNHLVTDCAHEFYLR